MGSVFWGEIEEIPENICGVVDHDKHAYFITSKVDDPIDREFTIHSIYHDKAPDTLIFGENGDQDPERDPEWIGRPCMVIEYNATMVGTLLSLSPTGTVPLEFALVVMIGCVRALTSLHRLGYVHRQVSPYTFAYRNPISYDAAENRIVMIDLSLALPWPCRPRTFVPFVGSLRYSSVRAHRGREQGPSDDIISLIYMIAEMISGKLPWRSVFDDDRVCLAKCVFYQSVEFKRLPRELRSLYRQMYLTLSPLPVDHRLIIERIQTALKRRCPEEKKKELPRWLELPIAEE